MAGSQYIALSGMRSRLDQLDRLAADIANVNTAGYKTERTADAQAERPQFGDVLQSAIDVTQGTRRLDISPGTMAGTGRDLDFSIEGAGFFDVAQQGEHPESDSRQVAHAGIIDARLRRPSPTGARRWSWRRAPAAGAPRRASPAPRGSS